MSKLSDIEKAGLKARGKTELIKHLEGVSLTLAQAAKGKCYDCLGYYADGVDDCKTPDCSLYPFMPYNPNRKKKVSNMSDERKRELSERLKVMRGKKKGE